MLNLLIALISNVYDVLKENSVGLYLNEIVMQRPQLVYNKNYSGILGAPFPFSFV
jgi:hypothetical protein